MLLIITLLSFLLIHLVPGDPARIALGAQAPPDAVQRVRHPARARPAARRAVRRLRRRAASRRLRHVDQPPAAGAGHRRPADLAELLPAHLLGMLISILVAVPLAIASALRRNRAADHIIRLFSTVTFAMPSFLLGLLLVLAFSLKLDGCADAGYGTGFFGHLRGLTLPAITVGLYLAPILLRTLRVGIIETLGTEFVEAARARGLSERRIVLKHVLRNSLIATVTVLGLNIGFLLSGAGGHRERLRAARPRHRARRTRSWPSDYPIIQALTLVFGVAVVAINLLDRPRLRQARSADAPVSSEAPAAGRPPKPTVSVRTAVAGGCSRRARTERRWGRGHALVGVGDRRRDRVRLASRRPCSAFENPNEQHLLDALQPPSLGPPVRHRHARPRHLHPGRLRRADRPDLRPSSPLSSRSCSAPWSARSPAIAAAGSTRSSMRIVDTSSPSRSSS